MKILVTGAGGFLGSHICQYFTRKGDQVWAVGRFFSAPAFRMQCPGIQEIVELDLPSAQMSLVLSLVKPDLLVHCASSASVQLSMKDPLADLRQSTGIYGEILDAVRLKSPQTTVALLSSASIYGQPKLLPTPETAQESPLSPYGHHKWMCEILSHEYASIFGIKTLNLRIFSAYGERLCKQVVYDILTKIHTPGEGPVELYGTGDETRDFIYAQDVARAIDMIHQSGEVGTFNLAAGTPVRISEIAQILAESSHPRRQIRFLGQSRPGDPDFWHADIRKIQALGFSTETSLPEGLSKVVRWFEHSLQDS